MAKLSRAFLSTVLALGLQGEGAWAQPSTPQNYLTMTCIDAGKTALAQNDSHTLDTQVTAALYAYNPTRPTVNPPLLKAMIPYIEYYCTQNPTLPMYAVLTQLVVDITHIRAKDECPKNLSTLEWR